MLSSSELDPKEYFLAPKNQPQQAMRMGGQFGYPQQPGGNYQQMQQYHQQRQRMMQQQQQQQSQPQHQQQQSHIQQRHGTPQHQQAQHLQQGSNLDREDNASYSSEVLNKAGGIS